MTTYLARPISPTVLKELRSADDAGRRTVPVTDQEGGAPLRCCLRRSAPGMGVPPGSSEAESLGEDRPGLVRAAAAVGGGERGRSGGVRRAGAGVHPRRGVRRAGRGRAAFHPHAHRTLRRYSADGRILGGRLVEPGDFEAGFAEAWAEPGVALVQVRAVEYGCFLYEVRKG